MVNLQNRNRIAKAASLVCGIAALAIFPLGIKLLDVMIIIVLRMATTELHRANKRQPTHFEKYQMEFFSSLISATILALVVPDPIHSFVGELKEKLPNSFLVILGVVSGLAFYGHRSTDIDDTRNHLVSFFVLSVVASVVFLEGQNVVISLVAIVVALVGAYLSLQKYDQVIIDEPTAHPKSAKSETANDTVKIFVVVGLTLFLIASQLDKVNPDMEFAAKLLSTANARHVKQTTSNENSTTTAEVPNQEFNQYNDPNMPEGVRKQLRTQCLHKTRDIIKDLLFPFFKPERPFTLLDYPNYWNLGDSFIYAGTEQLFRIYGQMSHRIAFPYDKYSLLRTVCVMLCNVCEC